MKITAFLILLTAPVAAQDFALRDSDHVPSGASLSDTILDRDLEYFDGGISRYDTGGAYAWTYADNNGGGVHTGVHDIGDAGMVCVTYDSGPERCDMFVMSGDRLMLLTDSGERYPLRDIR